MGRVPASLWAAWGLTGAGTFVLALAGPWSLVLEDLLFLSACALVVALAGAFVRFFGGFGLVVRAYVDRRLAR